MSFVWKIFNWYKGEKTTPLGTCLPGQIPGFEASPYYQLATIIEQWGPLRVPNNMDAYCLTDYFLGLQKDILITKEKRMAASMAAWPLLNALNRAEIKSNNIAHENELLKARIEKLEGEINLLTGKKPSFSSSNPQIRYISFNDDQDPEEMNQNKITKSDLEKPSETDSLEVRPVITQKTKKIQDRPAGVPPDQWPPAESVLHVTARPYTPTELMDLVQRFRQRPRESVPAWLLRLWDSGADSVLVSGPEVSKLATITVHPALRQRLYAGTQFPEENHSIVEWIMAACRMVWTNKTDMPVNTGMWSSMEDLQNYIRELGMREAIYEDTFDSPDMVKFSAGMRDLILQ